MKKTLIFLIFLFAGAVLYAQVNTQWLERYDNTFHLNDNGKSIAIDGNGNVYVTGSSVGTSFNYDIVTVKYNSGGVQQWVKSYNGVANADDDAIKIVYDGQNALYVLGNTNNGSMAVVIKYNLAGTQLWARPLLSFAGSDLYDLAVDASGNSYATGQGIGASFNYDIMTVKINSSGNIQWTSYYNGPANDDEDNGWGIALDGAGNVYVAGESQTTSTNQDFVVLKYNNSGAQQWVRKFDVGNVDEAYDIAVNSSGVYAVGTVGSGPRFCAIVKYNFAGTEQWHFIRSGDHPNFSNNFSCIALDNSGNAYAGGSVHKDTYSNFDYVTVKYSSSGAQLWTQKYSFNPYNDNGIIAITTDNSGAVYVTGNSMDNNFVNQYATIKYSTTGVQQWVERRNGGSSTDSYGYDLTVKNGSVYVTGTLSNSSNLTDYGTIKYNQITGIQEENGNIPLSYVLGQNYPNPFNPTTNIDFSIPKAGPVKIVVYDVTGREVSTIVNKTMQPGNYKADFDASTFIKRCLFLQADYR